MKERFFPISGQLWLDILKAKGEQHFRVIKNGLPEDAQLVRIEAALAPGSWNLSDVHLVITSSVFQDDDPDELPMVTIQSLYPAKGDYVPPWST
jgi:hypothetical protein